MSRRTSIDTESNLSMGRIAGSPDWPIRYFYGPSYGVHEIEMTDDSSPKRQTCFLPGQTAPMGRT